MQSSSEITLKANTETATSKGRRFIYHLDGPINEKSPDLSAIDGYSQRPRAAYTNSCYKRAEVDLPLRMMRTCRKLHPAHTSATATTHMGFSLTARLAPEISTSGA